MESKNESAVQQPQINRGLNFFSSIEAFETGQRMAKVLAASSLLPKQYQGNVGDCLIGLNMASRMSADPLMVLQNLVVVHGTPTFEAKFAIACFNATGKYTPIRYEEVGERGKDSWGMYAYAIDKATGDVLKGPEITIGLAKLEGWYNQNPKWRNVPQLMLRYRAASWFIRTTDPGVMLGFQTSDEAEDADYTEIQTAEDPVPWNEANAETIDIDTTTQEQPAINGAQSSEKPTDKEPNSENKEQQTVNKTEKTQIANQGTAHRQGDTLPMGKQPIPTLFK